jgi:hypothetical protein
VLARLDGAAHRVGAPARRLGVEVDRVVGVGQGEVEIGGPTHSTHSRGQLFEFPGVAADEKRIRHHGAARSRHASVRADRGDRAQEVLVRPHAPRDAVHDDADATGGHSDS